MAGLFRSIFESNFNSISYKYKGLAQRGGESQRKTKEIKQLKVVDLLFMILIQQI